MRISAELRINFCSAEEALTILNSIEPDNKPLPQGLELECKTEGNELVCRVETSRPVESFVATLDDLLTAIKLAEQVICGRLRYKSSSGE